MSGLEIRGLTKTFGAIVAVDSVDLTIPNGSLACLLGPSGCGKTTLLRLIAGLEEPGAGRILLDGGDITTTPAHSREFGMVFQSLALFPHMTVAENVAYGLRIRGSGGAERNARVETLLDLVQLRDMGKRGIAQLSGGQRQRVAIARALALEPKLFLLDEPLSALDANLREEMQVELRQLQRRLGVTTIVVTHDQREAMTMADIVVVMREGRVQQAAPPLEIYQRPANVFVAGFIGSNNLLPCDVTDRGEARVNGHVLKVAHMPEEAAAGKSATLSVRPEDVRLVAAGSGDTALRGTVTFVRDVGASVEFHVDCEGYTVVSVAAPQARPAAREGDAVGVVLPPDACRVLAS